MLPQSHFQVQGNKGEGGEEEKKMFLRMDPPFTTPTLLPRQWENGEFVKRSQWIKVMLRQATCQATGVLTLGRPERQRMCHLHPDQWTLGRGPKNGVSLRTAQCHQSLSHYSPLVPPSTPPQNALTTTTPCSPPPLPTSLWRSAQMQWKWRCIECRRGLKL